MQKTKYDIFVLKQGFVLFFNFLRFQFRSVDLKKLNSSICFILTLH